jgi:hypothetical protein
MESIKPAEILKQGVLDKLGGGAGGHKNWKARYFVLSDHLYYYNDQSVSVCRTKSRASGGRLPFRAGVPLGPRAPPADTSSCSGQKSVYSPLARNGALRRVGLAAPDGVAQS